MDSKHKLAIDDVVYLSGAERYVVLSISTFGDVALRCLSNGKLYSVDNLTTLTKERRNVKR